MSLKFYSNIEKLNADDVRVRQLSGDTDGIIAAYYDLSGNPSLFMSGASATLGNVGIKTEVPGEALTINGNVSAGGGYYGEGIGNVNGDFQLIAGEHTWYVRGASGNIEVPVNKGIQGGSYAGNQVMFPTGFGLQLNSLRDGTTYIQTGSAGDVNKTWAFSNDGALTLPTSGTIVGITNLSASGTVYASDIHAPCRINARTSSYTITLDDVNTIITINSSSATTLYIPANSAVPLPVGTKLDVIQLGTGQITVDGNGYDLSSSTGYMKTAYQHSVISLYKINANEWILGGDLSKN